MVGRPALSSAPPAVIHSGDYFLFESDSEEEEETQTEDPRPAGQSAFQVKWEYPLPAFSCSLNIWAQTAQGGHDAPRAWGAMQTSQVRKSGGTAGCAGCRSGQLRGPLPTAF